MNRPTSPRLPSFPHQPRLLFAVPLLAATLLLPAAGASRKPKTAGPVVGIREQKMTRVSGKHLMKARSLRDKGKNDLAIAEYRQALTIDPSSAEAALELGDLYFQLEIFPQCAEILEAGLPLAEQQGYDARVLGETYCRLARCHLANGAPEPAATALLKAAALIPNDPEPHAVLGDLQGARDRFDEAFNAYRRAVRADPQYTAAWTGMGDLAVRAGRAREASEALAGLAQADSQAAAHLRQAMTKAKIEPVPVPPPAPPAATSDPYADQPAPPAAISAPSANRPGPTATTSDPYADQPAPPAATSNPSADPPAPAVAAAPGDDEEAGEEAPAADDPSDEGGEVNAAAETDGDEEYAPAAAPTEDDPYGEASSRSPEDPGKQTGLIGTGRPIRQTDPTGAQPPSPNKVLPPVYKTPPASRTTAAGSAAPNDATSPTSAGNPTANPASGPAATDAAHRRHARPTTPSEPVPLPPDPTDTMSEMGRGRQDGASSADPTKATASRSSPIPLSPTSKATGAAASPTTPAPTPKATHVTGAGSPPAKHPNRAPAAGVPAANASAASASGTGPAAPPVSPALVAEAVARFASEDEAVAEQGRQAVLALGAPVVPALADKLADPDPNLRRRTLRVLAEFGETAKPAFEAIEEALADPDPGVVEAAQDALDNLGGD